MIVKRFWNIIPIYGLVVLAIFVCSMLVGEAIETVSLNDFIDRRTCFIIDAGHGGIDGGTVSCTGVLESQINLDISLRLRDLIELLGYRTIMIREDNQSIHKEGNTIAAQKASDLKERVRITNETDNGILLSIHQNHYQDPIYWGGQMFYAGTDGSRELAELLQTGFNKTVSAGSHRQIKKAEGLYLMKHIQKPGVLIECGFLSNYNESQKLNTKAYQLGICCVIATTCSNYANQLQVT